MLKCVFSEIFPLEVKQQTFHVTHNFRGVFVISGIFLVVDERFLVFLHVPTTLHSEIINLINQNSKFQKIVDK